MGNVRLYGSTSGYTELAPPAIAPDGVLSLPTGTGTLATTAFVNTAVAAGGKVLQVVSVTKVDSFTTTSTTFTDITGLTASITPSSTSSKILVLGKIGVNIRDNDIGITRLLRQSTVIGGGTAVGSRASAHSSSFTRDLYGTTDQTTLFLDSPNSVSSQTYKIQAAVEGGTLGINTTGGDGDSFWDSRTASTITLMEISA